MLFIYLIIKLPNFYLNVNIFLYNVCKLQVWFLRSNLAHYYCKDVVQKFKWYLEGKNINQASITAKCESQVLKTKSISSSIQVLTSGATAVFRFTVILAASCVRKSRFSWHLPGKFPGKSLEENTIPFTFYPPYGRHEIFPLSLSSNSVRFIDTSLWSSPRHNIRNVLPYTRDAFLSNFLFLP